jgi:hypothetical protein
MRLVQILAWGFAAALFTCGCGPENVGRDDPRVREIMKALESVDRASLGFSPIDPGARLGLEWKPRAGYDAMLHVYGKTSRTIAFRRRSNRLEWIHEQEIFTGPREFDTVDGRLREQICITYETAPVSGVPLNTIDITYHGDDPQLKNISFPNKPALAQVAPVLKSWGYAR